MAARQLTMSTMRMFAIKFARMHPQHANVRNAFAVTRTLDGWNGVLDRWYPREQTGMCVKFRCRLILS